MLTLQRGFDESLHLFPRGDIDLNMTIEELFEMVIL